MTKQQLLALLREAFKMGYNEGYNDSSELGIENSVDSEINYFLNCIDADNRVGDLELPVIGDWVSVKDQLPVGLGEVQVWVNGEDCFAVAWISTWSTGEHEWIFQNTLLDSCGDCITHWMPLPQPPEGV